MERRRLSQDSEFTLPRQAKRRRTGLNGFDNDHLYDRYAVAWICALYIEMAAARAMLDAEHDAPPGTINDSNSYVLGNIKDINIVVACLPTHQYGTNNAASVLSNLKRSFPNIRIWLMVGIGGGVPTKYDIRLGDIVVGVRVMPYDHGKTVTEGFQRTGDVKIPDSSIRTVISNLRSRHELSGSRIPLILNDKMREYPAYNLPTEPDRLFRSSYNHELVELSCDECDQSQLEARRTRDCTNPVIYYGAIASGNQVMKDATVRDEIARELDVICFEMEAAGLMDIMPCLPIRGICDYSDSHKAKEWQRYAAATAAAYAYEFLEVWGGTAHSVEAHSTQATNEDVVSSERREKVLESLNFEQIDARKSTIKAAHSKTCRWFLKHPDYLTWTDRQQLSQHHGFLWIRGKPGAGKSTIMKFIYSEAKKKDRKSQSLTASFFFNARGEILEKTVSGMYRSLLLQLFKGYPDLEDVLDDAELLPQNLSGCPSLNVLKDLLRSAISKLGQRSFTCFIDALDECDEQQVMDLVEYFEDLAEQCTKDNLRLQICFSSRHYPYIDIGLGLRLILEDQTGHTNDLESYITNHLRIRDPALLADLQARMLEKAAGVFLWVVLVVDILNQENRRGRLSLKKRLDEVPSGLSELFKDLLRRDKANMEELLLSLLWILLSQRPLKPEEYYHGLWSGLSLEGLADPEPPETNTTDADDCFERSVISSSKGLAEITKGNQPTVQFIHESVRDFLVKDKGLHELWPELGASWESLGHDRLKLCCSSYIQLVVDQEQITGLEKDVQVTSDVPRQYPFLEYASQCVLHHADYAGNTIDQQEFLNEFPTRVWTVIVNTFEKFKVRRYTYEVKMLYLLAERGHSTLIRTQLKTDPHTDGISERDRYKYPLIAAIAKGNKASSVALLGLPGNIVDGVDITNSLVFKIRAEGRRQTPLTWACEYGHFGIAKALAQQGVQIDETNGRGLTSLMLSSMNGHTEITRWLIDEGANINASKDGKTAIWLALEGGHAETVEMFLNAGVKSNPETDFQDNIMLHRAIILGHGAVVRTLLLNGANVNAVGCYIKGPLEVAAQENRCSTSIMEELLRSGANVYARDNDNNSCLIYALRSGNAEKAECLIKHGADVNARNKEGHTCLFEAAGSGNHRCIDVLLRNGVDILDKNTNGNTFLHQCFESLSPSYEVIEVLLTNGAEVSARNLKGQTCLHSAALRYGLRFAEDVVRILVSHGLDINARDNNGNTACHILAQNDNFPERARSLLKERGININALNHKDETPLHLASDIGNLGIAGVLITQGAEVNARDSQGRTPLDRALDKPHGGVADLLIRRGGLRGEG